MIFEAATAFNMLIITTSLINVDCFEVFPPNTQTVLVFVFRHSKLHIFSCDSRIMKLRLIRRQLECFATPQSNAVSFPSTSAWFNHFNLMNISGERGWWVHCWRKLVEKNSTLRISWLNGQIESVFIFSPTPEALVYSRRRTRFAGYFSMMSSCRSSTTSQFMRTSWYFFTTDEGENWSHDDGRSEGFISPEIRFQSRIVLGVDCMVFCFSKLRALRLHTSNGVSPTKSSASRVYFRVLLFISFIF